MSGLSQLDLNGRPRGGGTTTAPGGRGIDRPGSRLMAAPRARAGVVVPTASAAEARSDVRGSEPESQVRLPADLVAALGALGTERHYARGTTLARQGDGAARPDSADVRLLVAGHVRVCADTADGRRVMLGVRGPRELVGQRAVLDRAPRDTSVSALTPVVVRRIPAAVFRAWAAAEPDAARALDSVVGARLRATVAWQVGLSGRDTGARVAFALHGLATAHGRRPAARENARPQAVVLDIGLTQTDLTEMVGAAPASVTRALRALRTAGIVTPGRRCYVVHDMAALRQWVWDAPEAFPIVGRTGTTTMTATAAATTATATAPSPATTVTATRTVRPGARITDTAIAARQAH